MPNTGKFVRKYGNRNKIVRVRNEYFDSVVYLVASRLGWTYQQAFEAVVNYHTSKAAHGLELVDKIVSLQSN
jgi:hypothetical protein